VANQNFKVKKGLEVGTGVTISDGNINISGIITAQFKGDGSQLTGVTASGSGVVVQEEGSNIGTAATINFIGSNVTAALSGGIANVTVSGGSGGLSNVVEDTTPQLGGNLDLNSKDITGTGNISITGGFNATGVSTFQENVNFTSTASFGDNDKINLGTGNDLQIFHDGTSNIIKDEVGAGISLVGNTKVVGVLTATSLSGSLATTDLTGTITNAQLANDSVSFGGVSVDLGASDATPAFDLQDATNLPTTSLTGTITNAQLAGSIADGKLASTFLKNTVEDTTPQLGGNLDVNGKDITGTGGINLTGVATATSFSGSGSALTGLTGASAGTYGASTNTPIITIDSNGRVTGIATVATSGAGGGGGISNIVEDTTPQLGGNLDLNSKSITGTGNIEITGYAGVSGVSTFSGAVGFATHIHDAGTGGLDIRTNLLRIKNDADSETLATFAENGAVSFYHDNTLKFNTTSTGVNITGKLNVSGTGLIDDSVGIGTDPDAGYHSSTNGLVVKRGGINEGITIDCSNQAGIFFSNGSNGAVDINGQLIYYHTSGDESMRFLAQGEKLRIEEGGAVLPGADNAQNFGSTSKRWANIYSSGIVTATSFFGDGSGLTNLPSAGITTSFTNIQATWNVTSNGSSAYRFTGPGNDAADNNPDLYLVRGQRYRFTNNSGGSHPFQIRVASGGSAYSTGVTNNGGASGNIDFNVQHDAPERLYYQCTSHSAMVGNIYIVGGSDWRMTSVNTSTAPEIYTTRNVGIGTDNPSVLLDVNGDVSFNGTINGLNIGMPGTSASPKNTSLGEYALNSIGSGYRNTAVGHQALQNAVSNIDNTAVGSQVLRDSTAGSNTGVGSYSLLANTTGHSNTCIGNNSGKQVVDGIRNICLGYSAGQSITSGSGNTIIGANIFGESTLTDTVIIGVGNGVERLRIDSTGDVRFAGTNLTNNTNKSVNLTAPSYNTSEEDVNLVQVENESGFNQISFGGGTSALNAATTLRFLTASTVNTTTGTERLRITSDGRLGLGTISPGSVLDIQRAAAGSEQMLQIRSHATAAGNFDGDYSVEIRHATSTVTHGMLVSNKETNDARRTLDIADGGGVFATFTNGKVGVGTAVPLAKLHVSGSAWNNATGGDVIISNSSAVGSSLNLRPTNSGSYSAGWSLYAGASSSNIGDGNIGFWNHTSSTAPFKITQSGDASIADGNLVVASGHGINFYNYSSGATIESNLLDDYEEGLWTPTMSGATLKSQHTTGGSYPNRYTKIGRQVTLDLAVSWQSITGATALLIGGLPFTASNGLWGGGLWYNGWSGSQPVDLMFWVGGDTTYLKFYTATNGSVSALTQSAITTGGNIYGSITYFV
jgi:hypothetical protein